MLHDSGVMQGQRTVGFESSYVMSLQFLFLAIHI